MTMNLSEHFFDDYHAFVTFNELKAFCEKHAIVTARGKTNLTKALEAMGAVRARLQWTGGKPQECFRFLGLLDYTLHGDREFWGRGLRFID